MPNQTPKRKISPLAIIAIILILLALGMLFLIFAPGPRMKWALTMGEKYLTDCEYTQAVTMFSRAIRVDDRSETAYWGRAQAYVQLGDSAAATSDLTYIIDELGTENADVYLTRADLYMDMGDYDAARADLDAAASLGADTTEAEARLNEAAATDEAGNTPDAETPAATKIVSLPTKIVNYDQQPSSTTTLQYNADGIRIDHSDWYQTYDEHGNITYDGDYELTYANTYDEAGNLVTRVVYNGADRLYTESYTYDDQGNTMHYEYNGSYDRTYDWVYIYDAQGRVTSATRNSDDAVDAETKTYTYTDAGYTKEYTYLEYGERNRDISTYGPDGTLQKFIHITDYGSYETVYYKDRPFLFNWYSPNGDISGQEVWVYDTSVFANGLLTQYRDVRSVEQGAYSYTMDADGTPHLIEPSSAPTDETVTDYVYSYDADGNIVSRTAYTDGVQSEEITYTVMTVSGDFSLEGKPQTEPLYTDSLYKYKQYVIDDSRIA